MVVTLDELANSKIYVKSGSGVAFRPPMEYLSPVYDVAREIQDVTFDINALEGAINQNTENEELNIAYPRVSFIANFNNMAVNRNSNTPFDEFIPQMGALFSLDSANPFMRLFWGYQIKTCLNTSVWGSKEIVEIKITSGINILQEKAVEFLSNASQKVEVAKRNIEILKNKTYTKKEYNEKVGELLRRSLKMPKLGYTSITDAVKEIDNPKSIYYAKDECTAWNLYNATTEAIKKSSFIDIPSKSSLVGDLFITPEQMN